MKFILILMISTGFNHGGLGLTTQEFNTEKACLAAAEEVVTKLSRTIRAKSFCVPKG